MNDFVVVNDHPDMIKYVDYLQRKNAENLSFYPLQVFEREKKNGRIFLGLLNNHPCGYLYVGSGGRDVKCHQICIQYDARRKLYGAILYQRLEQYAIDHSSFSITLRCGFDLEANQFWKEMGFNVIKIEDGGIRRRRKINIWRKYLQKQLFEDEILIPSVGKTDSSIWMKNKQVGLISQFARKNKIKEYRKIVEK